MDAKSALADEWAELPDETKEMARQIIKTFAEKRLPICNAKEVLHACEIYMDVNCTVIIAH